MSQTSQFLRKSIVYKGAFDIGTAYTRDNVVSDNNDTYICVSSLSDGNPLTDTNHWFKLINIKDVLVSTIGTGTDPDTFILELTETNDDITITLNRI